jgi:hypothetical protein
MIFGFSSPQNMDIFKSENDTHGSKIRRSGRSMSKKLLLLRSKEGVPGFCSVCIKLCYSVNRFIVDFQVLPCRVERIDC